MISKFYLALVLIFIIYGDHVTSSVRLTHITQKSHPMLASLFNVANNIRRLDGEVGGHIHNGGIVPNGREKISLATENHGAKKQPVVVNFATQDIPSKEIPKNLHRNIHAEKIAGLENTVMRNKEVFRVTDIMSGSKGKPNFALTESSIRGISADVLCSLCHREGNKTCIEIHCWNNEIGGQVSELSPLGLQSAGTPIVSLPENFDFRNQMDRHHFLQLTTKNAALDQNVNRGRLDLQSGQAHVQIPGSANGQNMAPIWSMPVGLQNKASTSSTTQTTQPLRSLADRIDTAPDFQSQRSVSVGIGGSRVNANNLQAVNVRPVAVQQPTHGMNFVQANTAVLNAKPRSNLKNLAPQISEPISISTDILRQLIRLEAASDRTSIGNIQRNFPNTHSDRRMVFPQSGNANIMNSEISTGIPQTAEASGIDLGANHDNHGIRFPDGFVEGHSNEHRNDINPAGSVPQIPLANDVFSTSTNVDNTNTRHTLVIKDHGNTEVVGLHVGNGPILRSNVRPLETSGQNVVRQPQINQPEHTHAAEGHSHQVSQDHHSSIISNQHNHHEHSTATDAIGQEHHTGHHGMENTDHHGMENTIHHGIENIDHHGMENTDHHGMENTDHHGMPSLTTTTGIPTMDPIRRASLQNWSRELLQGFRL